jgi:hypothetical protein
MKQLRTTDNMPAALLLYSQRVAFLLLLPLLWLLCCRAAPTLPAVPSMMSPGTPGAAPLQLPQKMGSCCCRMCVNQLPAAAGRSLLQQQDHPQPPQQQQALVHGVCGS